MLIIFLFIAAFHHASSVPVLSPANPAFPPAIFGRELLDDVNAADNRTIQDIIWSCLATIFACTWVAVHPNVSRPQDSGWVKFRQRVLVMVYAILTPEFVIAWALRQRRGASNNTEKYYQKFHPELTPPSRSIWWYTKHWFRYQEEKPDRLWTITHGFLLEMHGFVDESGEVIQSVEEMSHPLDISEEEINDKSKGDFLTKTLVVAQTTWFIIQCVARLATHLPVTELEAITLAFALLNIGTYALWWNKPQNMGVAIRMDRYRRLNHQQEESSIVSGDVGNTPQEISPGAESEQNVDEALHLSRSKLSLVAPTQPVVVRRWIYRLGALMDRVVTALGLGRFQHLPFKNIITAPFKPLMAMAIDPTNEEYGDIFYSSRVDDFMFPLCFMIIGTVFGGLHLIPLWSSSFPSTAEGILWKVSAGWIVILPSLGFCSVFFVAVASSGAFGGLVGTFSLAVLGPYLIARIILIVLAFTTLRGLPPDTFKDISWTTFLPHV